MNKHLLTLILFGTSLVLLGQQSDKRIVKLIGKVAYENAAPVEDGHVLLYDGNQMTKKDPMQRPIRSKGQFSFQVKSPATGSKHVYIVIQKEFYSEVTKKIIIPKAKQDTVINIGTIHIYNLKHCASIKEQKASTNKNLIIFDDRYLSCDGEVVDSKNIYFFDIQVVEDSNVVNSSFCIPQSKKGACGIGVEGGWLKIMYCTQLSEKITIDTGFVLFNFDSEINNKTTLGRPIANVKTKSKVLDDGLAAYLPCVLDNTRSVEVKEIDYLNNVFKVQPVDRKEDCTGWIPKNNVQAVRYITDETCQIDRIFKS